jgi:hypothetical protein
MKLETPLRIIAISVVVFLAIVCLHYICVFSMAMAPIYLAQVDRQLHPMPFDKALWKAEAEIDMYEREPTREYMVDDLLGQYDLTKWHRNEVLELLGKPDHIAKDRRMLYYKLGRSNDYFYLAFDENGLVTKYAIVWDF